MSFFAKFKKGNDLCPVAASLYGTCATAAGTAEKAVTLPECDVLVPGMSLAVKFTNSNTAANPTLNVNSLGAVPIYRYGITAAGNTVNTSWPAGAVVQFTYGVAVAGNGNTEATYGFYMSGAGGVSELTNAVRDLVYPVGSIYMSVNATSPATILGGTWERINETFLFAAGTTHAAGSWGGATYSLLPKHTHDIAQKSTQSSGSSHSHTFGQSGSYGFRGIRYLSGSQTISTVEIKSAKEEAAEDSYRVLAISSGNFSDASATASATPTHNHTISATATEEAGATVGAENNMPPYLAVYVWKRTA